MLRPTDRKGWTVSHHKAYGRSYFQAVVIYSDRKRVFIGSKPTREEAIPIAITAAAKAGTLNWQATRIWCERQGVPLSYKTAMADLPQYRRTTQPSKGWYVEPQYYYLESGEKKQAFGVFFGRRSSDCIYQAIRPTQRSAVAHALAHRHENPHYRKAETMAWLRDHDMLDLIPLVARIGKREVAA